MRRIKIGFSTPPSTLFKPGASLIRWWIDRDYSHTYIQFTSERLNISNVYQASHGMVHFREFNKFQKDNVIIKEYILDISDEQYNQILRQCMDIAGEGYGYSELITIVLHDILFKFGIKLTHNGPGYVCSELIGTVIEILGISFEKPKYLLTPADIDECLKNWTKKEVN